MSHDEFVSAFESGQIRYAIAPSIACRYMETNMVPRGDASAFAFWNWAAVLSPVAAIILAVVFSSWWFLLLALALPVIWSANKKSATQVVLDALLKNPNIYAHAVQNRVLHIEVSPQSGFR